MEVWIDVEMEYIVVDTLVLDACNFIEKDRSEPAPETQSVKHVPSIDNGDGASVTSACIGSHGEMKAMLYDLRDTCS